MRPRSSSTTGSSICCCTAVAALLGFPGPGVLEARAQVPAPASCAQAGSSVRIQAKAAAPLSRGVISYVVTNASTESLQWIRIGEGGGAFTTLALDQAPALVRPPAGWRGQIVRAEGSDRVTLSWEAITDEAGVPPGAWMEFGILTRTNPIVREGLGRLDLGALPFSAGGVSGACWFGRTTSTWEPPEGGMASGLAGVTVRPIDTGGVRYVIVDAPMLESRLHLARRRPIFLTIPFVLSWGTVGGFSSEASIGIGLAWAPSPYVSVSAQTRFGTFFFNNRTHLRTVGVDLGIPIGRTTFAEGLTRRNKFLVIGAEYFDRDVVRWRGFMKGPQWYASGRGVAVRAGIRRVTWSY